MQEHEAGTSSAPRHLHLCVGPELFLPVVLTHVGPLGEPQMLELMTLLHAEVPHRLPEALDRGGCVPSAAVTVQADTIQASLTFVRQNASCWLCGDDATLKSVGCTLLVRVGPRLAGPAEATLDAFFAAGEG